MEMKNILTYEEFLNESKSVGVLYHYSNIVSILLIMKDMHLKDYTFNRGYVSFTRNGNGIKGRGESFARITIDGNKLSNKYKIVPDSMALSGGLKAPYKKPTERQAEERIYKSEVDLTNCILCIDIINDYANFELSKDELIFLKSITTVNLVDKFIPYK